MKEINLTDVILDQDSLEAIQIPQIREFSYETSSNLVKKSQTSIKPNSKERINNSETEEIFSWEIGIEKKKKLR